MHASELEFKLAHLYSSRRKSPTTYIARGVDRSRRARDAPPPAVPAPAPIPWTLPERHRGSGEDHQRG